jgi:hypothetical protein
MKPNKYSLLDKTEINEHDIELESNEPNRYKQGRDVPYSRLEDDCNNSDTKLMKSICKALKILNLHQ